MSEFLKTILGDQYSDDMTLDQVSDLLEARESQSVSEMTKLKTQLSKANSEAANYKKQLRGKQSEAEQKETEQAEYLNALKEENARLKKQQDISEKTAQYLALGYDSALAKSTAEALVDDDFTTVFKNQSVFIETTKKAAIQDAMKSTPRPSGSGTSTPGVDYQKAFETAQVNGNWSEAAYYTRLLQQQAKIDD